MMSAEIEEAEAQTYSDGQRSGGLDGAQIAVKLVQGRPVMRIGSTQHF